MAIRTSDTRLAIEAEVTKWAAETTALQVVICALSRQIVDDSQQGTGSLRAAFDEAYKLAKDLIPAGRRNSGAYARQLLSTIEQLQHGLLENCGPRIDKGATVVH